MIVPDTSAWIEFLRGTDHPVGITLQRLVGANADLAVTECVVMELLSGARNQMEFQDIQARLFPYRVLRLQGLMDFEEAARLFRACRIGGHTLRKQVDCLIAIPVIRAEAELLHNDIDFDVIARHSDLKIYSGIV